MVAAILLSKAFTPASIRVEHVVPERFLLLEAGFNGFNVVFMNIYASTDGAERRLFLGTVSNKPQNHRTSDYLFLGGDFNCTEDGAIDRNHAEPHPASQHALRQLVFSNGQVDAWRRMYAGCRQYSWSPYRVNLVPLARLDRFYCFKHYFSTFKLCKILPVGFSDHCLVLCIAFINNILPRSAYWHFN